MMYIPTLEGKYSITSDGKIYSHTRKGSDGRLAWNLGLCKPYDRTKPYNRDGIIQSNKNRRKCGI